MAKTIEDYKKILEKLQEGSGGYGDKNYMTIEDGDNVVRILPGHPNMDAFFVEVMMHQKGQGASYMKVICVDQGDPNKGLCEICPTLEELRQSDDKADKKLYKDQMSKPRFFFSVMERTSDHKDEEQKIVECGTMLLQEVLSVLTNEEYEDLLDAVNGTDVTIKKSGEKMDTEYKVIPRKKSGPILWVDGKTDAEASTTYIGTDEKDTQLVDLNDLREQFVEEPSKALLVWEKGWKALKDAPAEAEVPAKTAKPESKPAPKLVKKPAAVAAPAEDETPATNTFPKLKSNCSVCGDARYKTPSGNVCEAGHGGVPPLAEGARPSEPSKNWLKANPDPVEEDVEEEETTEEEDEPIAAKPTKTTKAAVPDDEGDEGLEDLSSILKNHSQKGKK